MADKHFIPAFISQKRGLTYFLTLYAVASIIFFFIYHPLGMFGENSNLFEPTDVRLYMIVLLLVGYIVLTISRVLLYNSIQKHPQWSFANAMLWVAIEFLIIDLILVFSALQLGNNDTVTFIQMLLRVTIDQIGLYMVPMLIVALISVTFESTRKYIEISKSYSDLKTNANALHAELQATRAQKEEHYRELLDMKEQLKNGNVTTDDNDNTNPSTLNLLRFTNRTGDFDFALPIEQVLYVETVDNYVSVNYLDAGHIDTRIIRNTMKAVEEQLQKNGFIRCHRQYLVNKHNIKSVSKEKDGIIIHLKGCDRIVPVGKTYAHQLV